MMPTIVMIPQYKSRSYRYLLLLSLVSHTLAADQNPLVSEGTCYYKAGKQADSAYIPCGNEAFGVYSCCMHGDNCLSSNACYNAKYSNAYIAGCTDPNYSDPACGNKGLWSDLQWAPVVRCYVSEDTSTNNEEWGSCDEAGQPVIMEHNSECVCTASAHTAVFTDNPNLTDIGVLPDAIGGTIGFGPGHTPSDLTPTAQMASVTSLLSTTSSRNPTGSAIIASSTSLLSTTSSKTPTDLATKTSPTSSTSSRDSSTSNAAMIPSTMSSSTTSTTDSTLMSTPTETPASKSISTAAEAGIGVGAGLGVLIVCAIIFLLYRRRLKKRYSQRLTAGNEPLRIESMRSPAWSGHKPELPATEKQRSELIGSTQLNPSAGSPGIPELEGKSTMSRLSGGATPIPSATTSTAYELPGCPT